ncbi:dihydroorotate dehydrogenase [candidate division KSB1 bacterium]
MSDLSVRIAGTTFKNPVLTASGTFGYGSETADLYDVNILGGLITKTITRLPRAGNPPPRLAETAAGMLNSIGLANVGIEDFIKIKLPYLQKLSTHIIVNIAGESHQDFLDLIAVLEDHGGISGYELNLSCPNVASGLDFSINPLLTEKLISDARKTTSRLLIPKLTPNVTDITVIARAAEDGGADAVSLINTLIGMSVDIKTRKPRLGKIFGGLSGPAIKPVALAKVYSVCRAVKIPVIGIGGISCREDALEFLLCGAVAVQLGTINFIDPCAPVKVIDGLQGYLKENDISSIRDVIGTVNA